MSIVVLFIPVCSSQTYLNYNSNHLFCSQICNSGKTHWDCLSLLHMISTGPAQSHSQGMESEGLLTNMSGSWCWLLLGPQLGLSAGMLICGLFLWLLGFLTAWQLCSKSEHFKIRVPRGQGRKVADFYDSSQKSQNITSTVLYLLKQSKAATYKGKGQRLHLSVEAVSIIL